MKMKISVWDDLEWVTALQGETANTMRIIREDGTEFVMDIDPDRDLTDQLTIELRRRTEHPITG